MPDRDEALRALKGLSRDELYAVVGELVIDPRVRRREGLRGWYYRYAGSIAFAVLIVLSAAGFFAIQGQSDALRDALIRNCRTNINPLRATVASQVRFQIETQKRVNYHRFFPSIPTGQLNALLAEQRRQEEQELAQLHPLDCEGLYP